MVFQIPVKHVIGDVDSAILEPTSKAWVGGIEDSFGKVKPAHLLGLFMPELLPSVGRGCSIKSYVVRVLNHQIS